MPPTVAKTARPTVGVRRAPIANPNGVLSRIKPIGFDSDEGIKILLYGRSGTGKTTLWATFPGRILAVICSGGSKPGELRSVDTPAYRDKIDQVALSNSGELKEVIQHVKESEAYSTVVLDHTSGLQDMILKEILGLEELPVQKGWGMAAQQQYGQCTGQTKEYLRALLNLDCHVVLVAQERESKGDEGGRSDDLITPSVGAGLMPSLAGWLNPAVDYICQTLIRQKEEETVATIGTGKNAKRVTTRRKVKGVEYCLRTGPDPVYTTKFRLPKGTELPDFVIDPSYDKLIELIKGN